MGGIARYSVELVRAMAQMTPRPDITLLAAGDPGPLAEVGFPVVRLPGCRLLPGLMTVGQAALALAARRHRLDLLHDLTGVSPLLFAHLGGVPTISTIQDVFALSYPGYSSRLDALIYRHWLPRMAPALSGVLTGSEQSRSDIQHCLGVAPERVRTIPLGVRSLFRPLPIEEVRARLRERFGIRSPYVLYVGALTRRKNIERSLEAFARLAPDFPELRLVLTGARSWQQSPIAETVARLRLADRVQLTGPVADADLPVLYSGARLFTFPSLYEGFGLPVLEAMACGTPVVTSNVSSLPEVAGDAAATVDPLDVSALEAAMRRILTDDAWAEQLRRAGLQQVSKFSWETTARATLNFYATVALARGVTAHEPLYTSRWR